MKLATAGESELMRCSCNPLERNSGCNQRERIVTWAAKLRPPRFRLSLRSEDAKIERALAKKREVQRKGEGRKSERCVHRQRPSGFLQGKDLEIGRIIFTFTQVWTDAL